MGTDLGVGVGTDLATGGHQPLLVLGLLAALLICKGVLLTAMALWTKFPLLEPPVFVFLLAQGGEFGFVVFQLGQQSGLINAAQNSGLVAAVALSVACRPLRLLLNERWMLPRIQRHVHPAAAALETPPLPSIIIAGFGP